MKGSFGFISMILGILGIARGATDSQTLGQMVGPGAAGVSILTLAAVLFLVGGLLILAKSDGFSFEGARGRARTGNAPVQLGDVEVNTTREKG